MKNIKIMRGNIACLKNTVDAIVIRSKRVSDLTFDKSKYDKVRYAISIPETELNEDNVLEYLEYYQKAIKKVKDMGLKTVAIEAIDLKDEGLNFSLAVEFAQILESAIGLTVGVNPISVTLLCDSRELCDTYELAIYGEIKSAQITMADKLERNEIVLIPTHKNILKFDKNYTLLKKIEPKNVFWKCYANLRLQPGSYFLVEGEEYSSYYFFVNLIQHKKQDRESYTAAALEGIQGVLHSAKSMMCKSITIPVVRFMRDKKENEAFVKELVDFICEYSEEHEVNIKFYCPEIELWDVVMECFEE